MPGDLKEALLCDARPDGSARCRICRRRCVVEPGGVGYCRTRIVREGKLYSLIYSKVSSSMVSPIEKKPLFHFYPGSRWLSLGTLGCNFRCPGCQNWEIAHASMDSDSDDLKSITPQQAIDLTREHNCKGISWTYNEPTIWFEYTLESAKLAKENGLLTNYVTNGFTTPEALDMIGPYLDAFRVDIKGFSDECYQKMCHIQDFRGIMDVTKRAKEKWGTWVEVVTNVTPGFNDDEIQLRGIASWIKKDLGEFTPWHVTQFAPHLELSHLPATPVSALVRARAIGLEAGLKYVYLGNVWGHPAENTHCHSCGKLLAQRKGFYVSKLEIKEGKCRYCSASIPGRFD